ncbi:FtsB family cell division protein [Halonatronum saccharophilum]|uniref:FtsB family cell division protein n=1 Tax=Halonatronum saccharophilum TaxID=150060 RepID=UPI0004841092|nr:cell division protein FtsL [Halonatronum saccharophilum]
MVKRPRREYLDHSVGIRNPIKKGNSKSKNNSFKYVLLYAITIFMMSFLVIIYINQYVRLSRGNYRLERLETQRSQLKNQNIHLELNISQLKSLDRVEEIAKNDLGMIKPDSITYIVLEEESKGDVNEVAKANESLLEEKEDKSIKARVSNFFNSLTEVQAGSLD